MQLRNEPLENPHRQRCYVCYRPKASCFCHVIPSIQNRTHILILQHVKERFHAFNTARIVKQALRNSQLIVDQTTNLAAAELPFYENTGLLYPGDGSRLLADVPASERPEQLVILDGTWHHAKTLMRDIPALSQLPKFRLEPATPSNYRIRKEPTETAVSTLEATVEALRALEPETHGLDQLLRAFDRMIDTHLEDSQQTVRVRTPKREGHSPSNIPHVLLDDIENVVVAYGEASHWRDDGCGPKRPVYWVAQRLGTGEVFECPIQSDAAEVPEFLQHLDLASEDFADAVTPAEFVDAWQQFLCPTDTIAVFNHNTVKLLDRLGAVSTPSITLKCVDISHGCSTLEQLIESFNLMPPKVRHKGRAGSRLANAIAYATYLNQLGLTRNELRHTY